MGQLTDISIGPADWYCTKDWGSNSLMIHMLRHFWDELFQASDALYEGRLINKLQNGIILLIFKIWKILNTGFVRNLIGHI